jgi:hypothetical protein
VPEAGEERGTLMPFPTTREGLKAAGYRFDNHAKCRGCRQDVEWYFTPKGKKMPFNLMPEDSSPAIAHWTTCPNAEDFRRP